MLTCQRFHSLLKRHGHIIVNAVASRTSQAEKIILSNLAKAITKWSPFAWLANGQRMNATIDRILFHLNHAGAFRDEDHIFRERTTDQEPSHARRVLQTILIGLQMVSMQGQWEVRSDYVTKQPPDLLISMVHHVEYLVDFVVCNVYLYIADMDADMGGTKDEHQCTDLLGSEFELQTILHWKVLAQGPSLLLQLLEMKPKFRGPGELMSWLWRISENSEPLRLDGQLYLRFTLDDLPYRVDIEHTARWRGQPDTFGIKYPGFLDLKRWIRKVPDEEAWVELMYERGWIKQVKKMLTLQSQD